MTGGGTHRGGRRPGGPPGSGPQRGGPAAPGAAPTAEIGIMRITEQIDALTVMALNPMRYLVAPSILAGLVTFPLMTALFDVVGIFGGYLVVVELLGLSPGTYFGEMQTFVDM